MSKHPEKLTWRGQKLRKAGQVGEALIRYEGCFLGLPITVYSTEPNSPWHATVGLGHGVDDPTHQEALEAAWEAHLKAVEGLRHHLETVMTFTDALRGGDEGEGGLEEATRRLVRSELQTRLALKTEDIRTTTEMSRLIGCSPATLRRLTREDGCPAMWVGDAARWPYEDTIAWLRTRPGRGLRGRIKRGK